MNVLVGSGPYNDLLGARWTDTYPLGSSGAANASGATVDTTRTGSFIITYVHTDSAGNVGVSLPRTVNVVQ